MTPASVAIVVGLFLVAQAVLWLWGPSVFVLMVGVALIAGLVVLWGIPAARDRWPR